jgi:hypothetical protein
MASSVVMVTCTSMALEQSLHSHEVQAIMKDTHDNSNPASRRLRTARAKGAALRKGLAALTKQVGSPAPTQPQTTATPPTATGAAPVHVSPAATGGEAFGAAMAAELDTDGELFGEGERTNYHSYTSSIYKLLPARGTLQCDWGIWWCWCGSARVRASRVASGLCSDGRR